MSKRIVITKDRLPEINSLRESYSIRYRIFTEDRNRFSYWSPIFEVSPGFVYEWDANNIDAGKAASHYNVIWEPVVITKDNEVVGSVKEYDIWIQWSKGEANAKWIYKERIEGNTTTFFIPSEYYTVNPTTGEETLVEDTPNQVSIEVYVAGFPVARETNLLTYEITE